MKSFCVSGSQLTDNLDFHRTGYAIQNLKVPPRSGEFSEK